MTGDVRRDEQGRDAGGENVLETLSPAERSMQVPPVTLVRE